ncbi:hypothetical protein ACIQWY_29740 [Streptomyces albidoflavus]
MKSAVVAAFVAVLTLGAAGVASAEPTWDSIPAEVQGEPTWDSAPAGAQEEPTWDSTPTDVQEEPTWD